MTTSARTAANRANAKRSTGPRTPDGKARAARNALRHGLNVTSSPLDPELEGLARRLGGNDVGDRSAAQDAAESQAHLVRIRTIKQQVLQVAVRRLSDNHDPVSPLSSFEVMAAALLQCQPQLLVLDGYERKARSRRKKAFRALWE